MIQQETLRVLHLSKLVDGKRILDDVSFYIQKGEMVGIIGLQNNGKSQLTYILSGAETASQGCIFLEGKTLNCSSIAQAQQMGIYSMSHQPQLVYEMTVAMNLFLLNSQNRQRNIFSTKKIEAEAAAVLEHYHLDICATAQVADLSPMEIRLIDLVRIAIQRPKLIILNNVPLADDDTRDNRFLRIVERMQRDGVSFLFVGNKFSKATMMCHRMYLMQSGILSSSIDPLKMDPSQLFLLLTGRPHKEQAPQEGAIGSEVLRMAFRAPAGRRAETLTLHKGEICGLVLDFMPYSDPDFIFSFLADAQNAPEIYRNGRLVHWNSHRRILRTGAVIIPDIYPQSGLFPPMSMSENFSIAMLKTLSGPFGWINRRKCRYTAEQSARILGLEHGDLAFPTSSESEMRLWIGRWLWRIPDVYIFLNPFASLDERGYLDIRRNMEELVKRGAGILIISSDYNRIHDVCGRVMEYQPVKI